MRLNLQIVTKFLHVEQVEEIATLLHEPNSDTEHQIQCEVIEEQNVDVPEYSITSLSNKTCSTIEHDDMKISETLPLLKSGTSDICHSSANYIDLLKKALDYDSTNEHENTVVSKIPKNDVTEMETLNIKQAAMSSELNIESEAIVASTSFKPKISIETLLGEDKGEILNILSQTTSEIDNNGHAKIILDTLPSSEKSLTRIRDDCKFVDTMQVEKSELQQIDFSNTDYAQTIAESMKSVSHIKCEDDIIANSSTENFVDVEYLIKEPLLSEFDWQSKSADSITVSEPVNIAQVVSRVEQEAEIELILQKPFSDTEHQILTKVTHEHNVAIPDYSIISLSSETCLTMEHDDINIFETLPLLISEASNIYQSPTDYSDDLKEPLDYVSNTEREYTVASKMLQKDIDETQKFNIKQASILSELDIKSEAVVASTTFKPQKKY